MRGNRLDPARKLQSRFDNDKLMLLVALAGVLALGFIVQWGLSIGHWRHDSYLYRNHAEMLIAVSSEGRWLGYLSAKFLPSFNPLFMWVANLLLIISALALLFRRLFSDNYVAINLALIVVLFPGIYAANTWPMVLFTPSVLLLAGVFAIDRLGLYALPIVAVVLFASMPWYYYILLVAVMPLNECRTLKESARFLVPGILWGVSLVGAYLFAAALNYFRFGQFGIELASWRRPRPATDISSLAANVQSSIERFGTNITDWLPLWLLCLSAVALIAYLVLKKQYSTNVGTLILRAGYAVVVMLSPYLTTTLAGINVPYRSLLPMAVGLIVLPFLLTDRSMHRRMILMTALMVGVPSFIHASSGVEWYARSTAANLVTMAEALPASNYKYIAVDPRNAARYYEQITRALPPKPFYMEGIDDPDRLTRALDELGFSEILTCPRTLRGPAGYRLSNPCREILGGFNPTEPCRSGDDLICVVGIKGEWLVLRLGP